MIVRYGNPEMVYLFQTDCVGRDIENTTNDIQITGGTHFWRATFSSDDAPNCPPGFLCFPNGENTWCLQNASPDTRFVSYEETLDVASRIYRPPKRQKPKQKQTETIVFVSGGFI